MFIILLPCAKQMRTHVKLVWCSSDALVCTISYWWLLCMVPSEFAISTNYGILIVVLCCIVIEPWTG